MGVPDGAPKDASDTSDPQETSTNNNNSNHSEDSGGRQMSLSSDEVNYLIFRYLQESGFVHSAFSFAHECMLGRTGLRSADRTLPPGALVTFLQKGLQYIGIEETLRKENNSTAIKRAESDFSLLSPPVISSISRETPPIQLNVPAASAAAAVKARLEARLRAEQNAATALSSQLSVNGPLSTLPIAMGDRIATARLALTSPDVAQAAAAQAAIAMSQLNQQLGTVAPPPVIPPVTLPQRSTADILALQRTMAAGAAPDMVSEATALAALADAGAKRSNLGGVSVSSKKSSKKQKKESNERLKESNVISKESAKPMEVDDMEDLPNQPGDGKLSLQQMNGQKEKSETTSHPEVGNGRHNIDNDATTTSEQPAVQQGNVVDAAIDSNVPDEEILRLEMHQSEVFMCAWNPVYTYLIATGSGDASARIWHMRGTKAKDGLNTVKLLPHGTDPRDRKNKDVTTLEWSPDGTLLATGSYDGVARVWARSGALIHTLRGHNGPIFSLKWNKRGNYLLSGSYDKTTIVWDVSGSTGFVEQQFTDHEAPALDVDWKDNTTFASCSTDKTVHICRVGHASPLKVYSGHQDEVNGVKWDPSGKLLASCSDDCTAKVWDVESSQTTPLYDFKSHQQEIYTVKWSPTGPGSSYPEKKGMLATASFDGSVRLWDVTDGSCFRIFNRHQDSVYSVAFSPSGDFLASGSLAGQMYIWNIEEGRHIKSYKGKGDIFEVAWNKEETRVAACFSSNVVAVIDFQRPSS